MWDVNGLFEYWQESPPTHVLVAAYLLGDKKRPRGKGKRGQASGFEELATAVQLAGGAVRGKLPASYKTAEVWQA